METFSIRLKEEVLDQLEREADERGFGTRTGYIRWIISNRPSVEPSTAQTLEEQINELEERLAAVEAQVEK